MGKRRADGEGWYETLPSGLIRLVKMIQTRKRAGPARKTKREAARAWGEKWDDALKAKPNPSKILLGHRYYFALYGVYSAPGDAQPTTRGNWAVEHAETTWKLYRDAFRAFWRTDPLMKIPAEEVTIDDLIAARARLLESGRKPRTVERYMAPVGVILRQRSNTEISKLRSLKKPPLRKRTIQQADRAVFVDLFDGPMRTGIMLALHGLTRSEIVALAPRHFDGQGVTIDCQIICVDGGGKETNTLKRERRYRYVPIEDPELLALLQAHESGRYVDMLPTSFSRGVSRRVKGTKWEGVSPHDLRASAAKWMLDAGAKVSDVADIIGNDPAVLLRFYDEPDDAGKRRAIRGMSPQSSSDLGKQARGERAS